MVIFLIFRVYLSTHNDIICTSRVHEWTDVVHNIVIYVQLTLYLHTSYEMATAKKKYDEKIGNSSSS